MNSRLVEINRKDLPILRNLYKSNGAKSYIGYMTINNYIRWYQQDPEIKHIRVFCLDGDFSDGTFVLTDRNRAYADTLNESLERLSQLLQLIDYSKGYRFMAIRNDIRSVLRDALQIINVNLLSDSKAILYYLPTEEAIRFDIQRIEGIELGSLKERHDIEKASEMWTHQDACSVSHVQRMAQNNLNVAAFADDGTLVSWILRLPIGIMGGLKTDDQYCGHGYGSVVAKALSKLIAESGDDVYAAIFVDNNPSHRLFTKLGFKPIGDTYFSATNITWSMADE